MMPYRWWLNRKSKNGSRELSRTPRRLRVPGWSTTPPIAKEKEIAMDMSDVDMWRKLLQDMVLAVTSEDAQGKTSEMLADMDDKRLAAIAREALSNLKRAKTVSDSFGKQLADMRKETERIRKEFAVEERALLEAQKAIRERDDIAEKYNRLQKEHDPEKHQLQIMYAIDETRAEAKEEMSALRRELGQRQTEVNELRTSKKRLREALDRLAGKD